MSSGAAAARSRFPQKSGVLFFLLIRFLSTDSLLDDVLSGGFQSPFQLRVKCCFKILGLLTEMHFHYHFSKGFALLSALANYVFVLVKRSSGISLFPDLREKRFVTEIYVVRNFCNFASVYPGRIAKLSCDYLETWVSIGSPVPERAVTTLRSSREIKNKRS